MELVVAHLWDPDTLQIRGWNWMWDPDTLQVRGWNWLWDPNIL